MAVQINSDKLVKIILTLLICIIGITVVIILGRNIQKKQEVLQNLTSGDDQLRWKSIRILVEKKDPPVIEPLIKELENEKLELRMEAVKILGEWKESQAIPDLIQGFRDNNEDYRNACEKALIQIGKPALEPLHESLKDKNPEFRVMVVSTLSKIKDANSVEPLITLLRDDNMRVRGIAIHALGQIGKPVLEPLIREYQNETYRDYQRSMLNAMGATKDPSVVEYLLPALKDEDMGFLASIIQYLGDIKDPRSVEPLIEHLTNDRTYIRFRTAEALDKIDDPKMEEPLMKALEKKDIPVIAGAYTYFIELGKEGSEPLLIEAYRDYGEYYYRVMTYNFYHCENNQLKEYITRWTKMNRKSIPDYIPENVIPQWGSRSK